MKERIVKVKEWYLRYERGISSSSILVGFVVDSLTLQNIDNHGDNIWIAINAAAAAVCIVLLNRQERNGIQESEEKEHFWLMTILQFSFGAIFGAFFIFYFRSSTLVSAWPFLLLLLSVMGANELFQKKYARLTSQISFLYLALFLFSIFLVPVFLHRMGALVFLLSGLVSLAALWLFIQVLKKLAHERFLESKRPLAVSVAGIYIAVNFLYFTNLIPPIPLSLKDAGIYHSLVRTADGYEALEEDHGIRGYFYLREPFHTSAGNTAYAYSAIYSPASLNTRIIHEWQYEDGGQWVTSSRINLGVSGGRNEGFRTYSEKSNLSPGDWRVNVITPRGQLIGRINFKVISSSAKPELKTSVKE